jgi:suppressor for copper-sensitivity B
MPCVLPVVLMKMKSLLKYKHDRALMIKSLTGSLAGNYAAFLSLAALLALLKAGGESVGWGFHFQNVTFLKLVVIALFLLTLHAFGILQFSLALQLKSEAHGVFWEGFISNAISALVALPCTAPFLGSAAAFAIQGSSEDLLLVFLAIGTGFSLPHIIAIGISEKTVAKYVMQCSDGERWSAGARIITHLMNYGVVVALLWMIFVIGGYYGGVWMLAAGALLMVAAICFKKNMNIVASFAVVALLAIPTKSPESTATTVRALHDGGDMCHYIEAEKIHQTIADAVAQTKVVIFSIDADWCLTCKSNRSRIFGDERLLKIIKNKNNNILCLGADITQKNDLLMDFIRRHGRIGIPFMMIFGPKAPDGLLLGEIPTVNDVLEAIVQASGRKADFYLDS